jgi:acyl dehydratase
MVDETLIQTWQSRVGQKIGSSDWLTIDQDRINAFADTTNDHQVIHVDPDADATKALGGTIAHGFLSLSLLSYLNSSLTRPLNGQRTVLNYGLNKVRFLSPVPTGAAVRSHVTVLSAEVKPKGVLVTFNTEMEIRDHDTPALVAEQLALVVDA